MLQDIATAVGLMMVFEGIMPFCLPERWRRMIGRIAVMDNRSMRILVVSMLIGRHGFAINAFGLRGHCDKYRRLVIA